MDNPQWDSHPEHRFEVLVGNVGYVYEGDDYHEMQRAYSEYKKQSKDGYGRAAGERVTVFEYQEIKWAYNPDD